MTSTFMSIRIPAGFQIVSGAMADLEDMLELEARAFTAPWTRKMFEGELLGNPFARFLLLREAQEGQPRLLAAYLCYWIVFDELRLMNLAVSPERRRQKLATSLVVQALREAGEADVKRALLEVRVSNEAARALYRRLGFQETGHRHDYYSSPVEDAVLMTLEPLATLRG